MDLPILVQPTLAGPMDMGANTSPSPQARTYILQPSSCTTHKVMLRIRSTILLRAFELLRDTIRGGTCYLTGNFEGPTAPIVRFLSYFKNPQLSRNHKVCQKLNVLEA